MSRLTCICLAACIVAAGGCQSNPVLRRQAGDELRWGDPAVAEQHMTLAVEQDPTDWKALYLLGQAQLRQQRPLEARLSLERALALRNDHLETPQIIDTLADALYQQADHDRLARVLAQACQDFGRPYDFSRQGKYLSLIGDADAAIIAYRKAARFAPEDPGPWLAIADVYESIGDRPRLIDALRRAYVLDSKDPKIAARLRQYGQVPGPTIQKLLRDAP